MTNMLDEILDERCIGETTTFLPVPPESLRERLCMVRRELSHASVATRRPGSLLLVKMPERERKVHALQEETIVGSGEGVNVLVPCPCVSRKHCVIWEAEGCWMLEDLVSRNGVYVNGERVSKTLLREGDIIQVGSASLIFLKDEKLEDSF